MSSFLDSLFTGGSADTLVSPMGTVDINNGSPALEYVLKIISTSPLQAAWSALESPLFAQLYDSSLEYVTPDNKYRVAAALQTKIANGFQPADLATYPVREFTPGGVALSDSNIVASIEAARVYAATHGGGRVIVPLGPHTGLWNIASGTTIRAGTTISGSKKAAIDWRAAPLYPGGSTPLWLEGVPGAGFIVSADCDVGVYFSPNDATGVGGEGTHQHGGLRYLIVNPAGSGQTTQAFRFSGAVNCRFYKLRGFGMDGASGGNYGAAFVVRDDYTGGNGNSQFCSFEHLDGVANQHDYDLNECTSSRFQHCHSQASIRRAWLISGGANSITVQNSGLQESNMPVFVEIVGHAFAAFIDCYTEGSNPGSTLFKNTAIDGDSWLLVQRYTNNCSDLAYLFDIEANCNLHVDQSFFALGPKILKASPINDGQAGPYRFTNNVHIDAADVLDSSKFEINDYAKRRVYVSKGGKVFAGGELITASPVRLASFAEGAEPGVADSANYGAPAVGQLHWNSTQKRPRVRGDSAYHDVALLDDPKGVTGIIRPYCSMILDPRIYKLRSVISGGLDTIADVLNPTTNAAAPSSGRRPEFSSASDAFGGKPTFTCAKTGDKMLQITLATPIPIGAYPGLIVVARVTTALQTGTARRIITSIGPELRISAMDDQEIDVGWGSKYTGSVATQRSNVQGAAYETQFAYAAVLTQIPIMGGQQTDLRLNAVSTGNFISSPSASDPGGLATAITGFYIGAIDASTGNAADVEIAYIAALNQVLPQNVETAFWDAANTEWALGF